MVHIYYTYFLFEYVVGLSEWNMAIVVYRNESDRYVMIDSMQRAMQCVNKVFPMINGDYAIMEITHEMHVMYVGETNYC